MIFTSSVANNGKNKYIMSNAIFSPVPLPPKNEKILLPVAGIIYTRLVPGTDNITLSIEFGPNFGPMSATVQFSLPPEVAEALSAILLDPPAATPDEYTEYVVRV